MSPVLLTLFAICCGVAGCAAPVDLSAVSKYAATTAQAGSSFSALASDYYVSCIRETEASEHIIDDTTQPAPLLLGDISRKALLLGVIGTLQPGYVLPRGVGGTPTLAAASTPTPIPSPARPEATATAAPPPVCPTEHEISGSWDQSNGIILSYVQSLGALAAVDAVPTPNPSPLASPLLKIGVTQTQITAGSNVLSTISSFFAGQAQEHAIATFLAQVNPSMKDAVESLEVVDAAYAIRLQNEHTELTGDYRAFVDAELATRGMIKGDGPAAVAQRLAIDQRMLHAKQAVVADVALINQRRTASIAYGSAIAGILKTHEDLYDASTRRATIKDYIGVIQTTGAPVVRDLEALAKAVK
jgi:hypothetical protein